jgi:hypothetical protein
VVPQASEAYVMIGSMACLYIVNRLWNDMPHVALEQRTSMLRIRSNLSSRCWEWGNQSSLQSSMTLCVF